MQPQYQKLHFKVYVPCYRNIQEFSPGILREGGKRLPFSFFIVFFFLLKREHFHLQSP